MKNKMKVILVTILLLAGITGGGYYFLTRGEAGPSGDLQKRMMEDQTDLGTSRAYRYDLAESAILLSTSGEEKNVLNFENQPIYRVQQSNADRERLDRLIKRTDADFDKPIIALNPFGTNPNSFYFYFTTSYRCMIRYTITVEDESIHDHIRYVQNGKENNMTKTHEFVVSGLIPGKTNYIILEQLDSTGARRETKAYKFDAPKVSVKDRIEVEEGYSKETSKSGMFCVMPEKQKQFYMYDNQGILRNVTATEGNHGGRFYEAGDCVIYSVSEGKYAKVSALGRVVGVAKVSGCDEVIDFSYDGYDEIYVLGKKKGREHLYAVSFSTGKTRNVFEFPKGIVMKSLSEPKGGSVFVAGGNLSGIACVDGITSKHPRISFVLGRKAEWKKYVAKKKIQQDKEVCCWDTKQSRLSSGENNTLYLMVEKRGKPMGVQIQVDLKKKNCKVVMKQNFEGKPSNHVQVQGDHMILVDQEKGMYAEYDSLGKVTRKFRFGVPVEEVVKVTLAGMCFYYMQ